MAQFTFFAILPFVLPALGANLQGRNNWGTTTAAISSVAGSPALPSVDFPPVPSSVFATPALPSVGFPPVASSVAGSPAFPSVDIPTSTAIASPVPTSYFNCGGSNFTVTVTLTGSSYAGQPTGVTTVTYSLPSAIASHSFSSGIAYPSSSIASGPVTVTSSRLAARNNWGNAVTSTVFATASSFTAPFPVGTASSSVVLAPIGTASSSVVLAPIGTASSSVVLAPIGTASSSIGECPYPTSTVYASGTGSVMPSSSIDAASQLSQTGNDDSAAVGMAVSAGSVVMGAIAIVAHLL